MWRELIRSKFEEKFPLIFENCKDQKFLFLQSDKSCVTYDPTMGATVTFKYAGEKDYGIDISANRTKRK